MPKKFAPHIFVTFFVAAVVVVVAAVVVVLISHLAFDFNASRERRRGSGGGGRRSTLIALKFQVGLSIPTINYKFVGCFGCCCFPFRLLMRLGTADGTASPSPPPLPSGLRQGLVLMFFKPFCLSVCLGGKSFATY